MTYFYLVWYWIRLPVVCPVTSLPSFSLHAVVSSDLLTTTIK